MQNAQPLSGQIALITGASRGIGAALAPILGGLGAQLVLVGRTVGGLEATDDAVQRAGGTAATLVPLDLREMAQIDALGAMLYARFGKLDLLIGNAAQLGDLSPVAHAAPAMAEDVFDINVLANYRLLRSMDPLLRASGHARVVMVTSSVARKPHAYWGIYSASKAALENLTLTYAAEVDAARIRVNLFDPGATATAMRARAFPSENPGSLPSAESTARAMVPLLLADAPHATLLRAA